MEKAVTAQSNIKKKSFTSIRINADTLTHFFCFFSVLLIGADLIGVNVGVNLRFDQVLLLIMSALLLFNGKFRAKANKWIIAFAVFSLISTLFAHSFKRGLLFYFSIIYNIVFIFYAFSSYVRAYGLKKFIGIFRKTCFVQFAIFLLQYFLKVALNYEFSFLPTYGYFHEIPRFRLWFYEPSYLATYLTFWFSVAVYMLIVGSDRRYFKDILCCLIMLILCTSTTGFLGIALVVLVVYFVWLFKGVTVKKLVFPIVVLIAVLVCSLVFKDIFDVFIGRLFNSTLDTASGGRVSGWSSAFDVFKEHPLFGIGPGNYGLFVAGDNDVVPSNVTLELMATAGIFATVAFYALTLSLIVRAFKVYKRNKCYETKLLVACAIGLIIFTVVLQANQGYLRLYHWMFFGIIEGGVVKSKR